MNTEEKIKMYCIFARESLAKMQGNVGKLAAQAGHAYLHSSWDATARFIDSVVDYRNSAHAYKICCVVDSVKELEELWHKYKPISGVTLVKDAGFTVFSEPTVTCLGIGPIREGLIGEDIRKLELLKNI